MGPLSTYYTQENDIWLQNNPGRVLTSFRLSKLFGATYCNAAKILTAVSELFRIDVCPNQNIFSDADFMSPQVNLQESAPSI